MKKIFSVLSLFTMLVFQAFAGNTMLKDLTVLTTGGASISPNFQGNIDQYAINLQSDIGNVFVKPLLSDSTSTIKIDGKTVNNGDIYNASVPVGKSTVSVFVTATDGTAKTYNLNVMREDIKPIADKFLKFVYTDKETGLTMPYRLFIPENYDPKKTYPLVMFMHGGGERGDDNEKQLLANQGATIWAKPEEQAKRPCFVLAPQSHSTWDGGFGVTRGEDNGVNLKNVFTIGKDLKLAHKVLNKVLVNYNKNIVKNRLYCTGLSQGGFGTWLLNEEYPNLFAAMVPVSGGGNPEKVSVLVNKPIWAFHAENDSVIPVSYDRNTISALRNLGANPIYTEYNKETFIFPDGHFAWVLAYKNEAMREWLFKQKKN